MNTKLKKKYDITLNNYKNLLSFLNKENNIYQILDNNNNILLNNYDIKDLLNIDDIEHYFINSIMNKNYEADKLNIKKSYYYDKYYKDNKEKYIWEVYCANHYNYSWDEFCDKYNLEKYKVNNINQKLYYYLLKITVINKILNNNDIILETIKDEVLNKTNFYEYKDEYKTTGPKETIINNKKLTKIK